MKILVINPGSTSTKIAVFEDERNLFTDNIEHSQAELAKFSSVFDQLEMRAEILKQSLRKHGFRGEDFAAAVGRGGGLPGVQAGAYLVTLPLLNTLQFAPQIDHASNIGAFLAHIMAEPFKMEAYIYDAITVDELEPIARVTGLKEMSRRSQGHMLNMRAAAIKKAKDEDRAYGDLTMIVAHMGGGTTLSIHHKGRIIDMISDDEGPFSPERAGGLPGFQLMDMAFSGEYDYKALFRKVARQGGLMSHFGTTDAKAVLQMMKDGDEKAALVLEAMCHNVAKNIGKLAVVTRGKVDHIVLTGGLAHSKVFTGWIEDRVSFLAPVTIIAGENEMESLALGALRVLKGEENAKIYEPPFPLKQPAGA